MKRCILVKGYSERERVSGKREMKGRSGGLYLVVLLCQHVFRSVRAIFMVGLGCNAGWSERE
jgi:hypothetical protein